MYARVKKSAENKSRSAYSASCQKKDGNRQGVGLIEKQSGTISIQGCQMAMDNCEKKYNRKNSSLALLQTQKNISPRIYLDKPSHEPKQVRRNSTDTKNETGQDKPQHNKTWHEPSIKKNRICPSVQMEGAVAICSKPIQTLRFSRLFSSLYYTDAERELLVLEKDIKAFYVSMKPYAVRFPEINQMGINLNDIENANLAETDYEDARLRLNNIRIGLDSISSKIAAVGVRGDAKMMTAYGTHSVDTIIGQIIQIYLDTINVLPDSMNSKDNHLAIKSAIYPDINILGYKEEYLGDSDVEFAKYRHMQIVKNLWSLDNRIRGDWTDLQERFHLIGDLKSVSLTGSDLHKGGRQVVIIESQGGQKVVYKPRSVVPDAALMDFSTGFFPALNKKGADLLTIAFHSSREEGSYVEYVEHCWVKTPEQIEKYYFQVGQLVVAAKLFGVNDLHYENIMAAGRGPTIIDAETSFLMNVMTAQDFQSNELQKGVFEHVSEIDNKLSNNSFYTLQEKQEWDERGENERRDWDDFIGDKRNGDVKPGGPYEHNLKDGVQKLLLIVKNNRKEIIQQIDSQLKSITEVRVVPIGTSIFKSLMRSYRDHRRRSDSKKMATVVELGVEQVSDSLSSEGYELQDKNNLFRQLREDFNNDDIPLLQYNGKTNQLTWNDQVVGSRSDHCESKNVVSKNIKWLVTQTADDVLASLQK